MIDIFTLISVKLSIISSIMQTALTVKTSFDYQKTGWDSISGRHDLNDGNSLVMSSVDNYFEGVPLNELCTVYIATVEIIINKSVRKFCELYFLLT